MKELKGNLFEITADVICITTNGIVKKNGEAVMGAGIALELRNRAPLFPKIFGDKLKKDGNHVSMFLVTQINGRKVVTFPVKHHFKDEACLELIERSCKELVDLVDKFEFDQICLPKPGCGAGKLNWKTQVKPICEKYFDDRFFIVDLK